MSKNINSCLTANIVLKNTDKYSIMALIGLFIIIPKK